MATAICSRELLQEVPSVAAVIKITGDIRLVHAVSEDDVQVVWCAFANSTGLSCTTPSLARAVALALDYGVVVLLVLLVPVSVLRDALKFTFFLGSCTSGVSRGHAANLCWDLAG